MDHHPTDSQGSAHDGTWRLRRIERRWKTRYAGMMDSGWWETWTRARTSFLVGMILAAVLLPLDWAFWDDTAGPFRLARFIPLAVFQGFGVVLLVVNALLMDVFLVWRTRGDLSVERGIHLLRFLLGSLPLVGFYAINFWQWALARRPRWAVLETGPRRTFYAPFYRRAAQLLTRSSILSVSMLLWFSAGNILFLMALSAKLNELRLQGTAADGIRVFQVVLHVAVCCCLVDYVQDYVRQKVLLDRQRFFLWMLPWLALPLPFPCAFASVGTLVFFELHNTRDKTLCWMAYRHGAGVARLAAWARLQEALDESPGLLRHRLRFEGVGRAETTGRVGRQLTTVYRLKTLLLGVDALALGWLLVWMAEEQPGRQDVAADAVAVLTWTALSGAGAAFLFALSRTLVRSLGRPQRPTRLDAHAYGSFLALGLCVAATGLNAGVWLHQGQARQAAVVVMLFIALGLALAGLMTVLQPVLKRFDIHQEMRHDNGVWLVFFVALMVASGLMAVDADRTDLYVGLVGGAVLLGPMWHLLVAVRFHSWLLRPYRLPSLLDGRSPRGRLAFLLLTLVLPWGGLAVPYWIFARHRGWPSHDPICQRNGS